MFQILQQCEKPRNQAVLGGRSESSATFWPTYVLRNDEREGHGGLAHSQSVPAGVIECYSTGEREREQQSIMGSGLGRLSGSPGRDPGTNIALVHGRPGDS